MYYCKESDDKMAKLTVLSFIFVVFVAHCNGLAWKDCGSAKGTIKKITIPGCETTPVCTLHKGSNISFSVEFASKEEVTKATAVVHGIIAGIPIPFPIDNPDGCSKCGLTCPLKSGADYTYKTTLSVKSSYPSVKVIVKWELKDQDNNDIFCMELPAQIASAKTNNKLYFLSKP